MIYSHIGISHISPNNSFAAGVEAASAVLENSNGNPKLLFILNTPEYNMDELLSGITSITGDIPNFGCTADGILTKYGFFDKNSVSIMALQTDNPDLFFEYQTGQPQESGKIGKEFAEKFIPYLVNTNNQNDYWAIIVLIDNNLDYNLVTKNINNVIGPLCPIIGTCVHGLAYKGPYINGQIRPQSVVGVLLRSSVPIGIDIAHGWHPYGPAMVVTRSEGRRLYEINGQPALEVYKQIWSKDFPEIEGKTFSEIQAIYSNFAVCRPIGLVQPKGENLIRDPFRVNEDGSFMCGGEIPEHAVIHLMQGNTEDLLSGPRVASEKALDRISGHNPEVAIVFDCFTRQQLIGFNSQNELHQIQKVVGQNTNIFGMMSRGEIATSGGATYVHNKTVAVGILPKYNN